MIVYGDRPRREAPRAVISRVRSRLADAAAAVGHVRHDALTEALIVAGELLQGLADAEFDSRGLDDVSPLQEEAMSAATAVALAMRGGEHDQSEFASSLFGRLERQALPPAITCKTAEGYAFYAVRPHDYMAAAAALVLARPPLVIGLRSIGASLAPAVTAAVGGTAITVRPTGHPFAREIRASERLKARLAAHPGEFIVVDEGPGLSGSSFAAVAALLGGAGVEAGRIIFMPSHRGDPGRFASGEWAGRWRAARKQVRTLDDALAAQPASSWFEDVTGPVLRMEDLSGGGWRSELPPPGPPAAPGQERRKFRLETAHGRYLLKFAGLGETGRRKFERGRALHAAGLGPELLGLRGGFHLWRWSEGRPMGAPADRGAFLARLGRYLGFRAATFREPGAGASLDELARMAATNAEEAGGPDLARRVERRLAGVKTLAGELAPGPIDGRLCGWEWIETEAGLLKTDALDHAEGHDLIGCQDVAWDVAGAACEFQLTAAELAVLAQAVGAARGRPVAPAAVDAFRTCYAAFQVGLWSMAADAAPAGEVPATTERRKASLAMLERALQPPARARPSRPRPVAGSRPGGWGHAASGPVEARPGGRRPRDG